MANTSILGNGVKAASEALISPGSSLILDGDIKGGAIHVIGGLVARALLGPIGVAYFAANSYSNSVSGKHLHQHLAGGK